MVDSPYLLALKIIKIKGGIHYSPDGKNVPAI
jgi:hypothetical protein